MNIIKKEGFDFSFDPNICEKCPGVCCTGESGYIWINKNDVQAIATFIKKDTNDFLCDYTKRVGTKISLQEIKRGASFDCIFFDQNKKQCSIYPARPIQCKTFPFWNHYKDKADEVLEECPGVTLTGY